MVQRQILTAGGDDIGVDIDHRHVLDRTPAQYLAQARALATAEDQRIANRRTGSRRVARRMNDALVVDELVGIGALHDAVEDEHPAPGIGSSDQIVLELTRPSDVHLGEVVLIAVSRGDELREPEGRLFGAAGHHARHRRSPDVRRRKALDHQVDEPLGIGGAAGVRVKCRAAPLRPGVNRHMRLREHDNRRHTVRLESVVMARKNRGADGLSVR